MEKAIWFFDLVSPFSYLHHDGLHQLRDRLDIEPVPAGAPAAWNGPPCAISSRTNHSGEQ